jgi:multidrug efflux system outer membrane protein
VRRVSSLAGIILLTGCTVGPNYVRPSIRTPAAFRAAEPTPPSPDPTFADLKWFDVFHDEQLQKLIRTALDRNYDLLQAVARVEEARANLGVTRSQQFPNFGAGGAVDINRLSRDGATALSPEILPSQNRTFGQASLQLLSFEIDIWGRLRRATEIARANVLSSDEKRKAVMTTLVSDVATAYLTLRELDYALGISRRTLENRERFLQLTRSRQTGGVGTLLDLRQAEQLVYTAAESIPSLEQQIDQTENRIHLLLGDDPGPVPRGLELTDQKFAPDVPPGLPSALLERRPDIRAAEQDLIAANAEIGVARAAYFPQLSLTGALGGQSTQLSSLFIGPHSIWSLTPQLAQPVFTAGRLKSQVQVAQAEKERLLAVYEKAIRTAFNEVSDALIARTRVRQSREKQELLVSALQDRLRLAYLRYNGGVDTQLNALDADRDLFQAELDLAQLRLQELLAVVQLYKALGGGWQR